MLYNIITNTIGNKLQYNSTVQYNNKLQYKPITTLVSTIINMNQPQIYVCPLPPEPPSSLPAHPTPLRCHRALDLSSLHQYREFPLAVYFTYGNVYVSMLLSRFISPFPFPGKCEGQGSLACCSTWGRKQSDTTE